MGWCPSPEPSSPYPSESPERSSPNRAPTERDASFPKPSNYLLKYSVNGLHRFPSGPLRQSPWYPEVWTRGWIYGKLFTLNSTAWELLTSRQQPAPNLGNLCNYFVLHLGELFHLQVSYSSHSEPSTWAHLWTPAYLLCTQLCCEISSIFWQYKRSHLHPRYWGRCRKYNSSQMW